MYRIRPDPERMMQFSGWSLQLPPPTMKHSNFKPITCLQLRLVLVVFEPSPLQ